MKSKVHQGSIRVLNLGFSFKSRPSPSPPRETTVHTPVLTHPLTQTLYFAVQLTTIEEECAKLFNKKVRYSYDKGREWGKGRKRDGYSYDKGREGNGGRDGNGMDILMIREGKYDTLIYVFFDAFSRPLTV